MRAPQSGRSLSGDNLMSVEHAAALVCAWLATYFIHSTLLLVAAWATTRKLPSAFDGISELMWRVALGLPVLSATLQAAIPPATALGSARVAGLGYAPAPLMASRVPAALWIGAVTIWVLGALLGLFQLYLSWRLLRRQI